MPWDVAWNLSEIRRHAYLVAFGELEGDHDYNWDTDTWTKRAGAE